MKFEKSTIRCEAFFSDDHTHRFLWRRIWNKDKPTICVLMLNPVFSDTCVFDTTTNLVVSNVARLETYGGVEVVNLYSILTNKLNFKHGDVDDFTRPENDECISQSISNCETVVIGFGKGAVVNYSIAQRALNVLQSNSKFKDKMFVLSDGERIGLHPLTPTLRSGWSLEPLDYEAMINSLSS